VLTVTCGGCEQCIVLRVFTVMGGCEQCVVSRRIGCKHGPQSGYDLSEALLGCKQGQGLTFSLLYCCVAAS